MAIAELQDLDDIIRKLAPCLSPQFLPHHGEKLAREALGSLFQSSKQRKQLTKALDEWQVKAKKRTKSDVELVLRTDLDIANRVCTITGLAFVSEVEACLSDAKRFLGLQLASDASEMEPYCSHFRAKNGYRGSEDPLAMREVFAAAYSLQILVDSLPGWETRLGGSPAPFSASVDIEEVVNILFDGGVFASGRHSAKRQRPK